MPGLELMAVSEAAGVFAVKEKSGSQFFVMGHPEYDRDTLAKEYFRDVEAGKEIHVPEHYFPHDDAPAVACCPLAAARRSSCIPLADYYVYQT